MVRCRLSADFSASMTRESYFRRVHFYPTTPTHRHAQASLAAPSRPETRLLRDGETPVHCSAAIMLLARAQHDVHGLALCISQHVQLCAQPAASTAKGCIADTAFFRLPATWAWARMTDESSNTSVQVRGLYGGKQALPSPFCAQRRLRLRRVSCLPKRAGRARQTQPWRATQNYDVEKEAWAAFAPPGRLGGAKAAHAELLSSSSYIVPECDGVPFERVIQQKLWDNYFTAVPAQRRQYDAISSVVRKASKR